MSKSVPVSIVTLAVVLLLSIALCGKLVLDNQQLKKQNDLLVQTLKAAGAQVASAAPSAKNAAGLVLTDLSGQSVNLADRIKDKKAVLFFWATWCPHCRVAIEKLPSMMDELKAAKVEVVLIDIGESADKVQRFLQSKGIDLPVLLDKKGEVSDVYEVQGIPSYIFVGPDGQVKAAEHSLEDYAQIFQE